MRQATVALMAADRVVDVVLGRVWFVVADNQRRIVLIESLKQTLGEAAFVRRDDADMPGARYAPIDRCK
jgi:hypothetical protein